MKLALMRTHRFYDSVNRNLFLRHSTSSSATSRSSCQPRPPPGGVLVFRGWLQLFTMRDGCPLSGAKRSWSAMGGYDR